MVDHGPRGSWRPIVLQEREERNDAPGAISIVGTSPQALSPSSEHSIAILGAGPAGCAAARMLASLGHDVTVLARRGGERSLGESLPPSCVALLKRIGFADLDSAGFLRSTGNTVRWGAGDERVERFAAGQHGYQVERSEFDAFLVREATGAGADFQVANVTSTESLQASWILDCTGRAGLIARNGWRRPEQAARTTAIVGVWEHESTWPTKEPSHTIVESAEDGWAWSVPVSERRRYVTLMVDPTRTQVASREGLHQAYLDHLARTRSLAPLVKGATLQLPVFARDASPYTARAFGERGVLLVGDAGSFVDPLSSFGIKKALASAWLASVVVHSIITDPRIADAALSLYDARERAMYDALKRSAAALAREASQAHPTGFWESRAAAAAASDPDQTEPDVTALRADPDVLRALEQIKSGDTVRFDRTKFVQTTARATVRGNRVVIENHLVVPAFPEGVRWVRNVDLERLSELALSHDQVPEIFDAYNRSAPPVPLPDFLGALALLVGKGFLTLG